jgi:hypothetical protein
MAHRKRNKRSKRAGIGGTCKREELEQRQRLEQVQRSEEEHHLQTVSGRNIELSSVNRIPLTTRRFGATPLSSTSYSSSSTLLLENKSFGAAKRISIENRRLRNSSETSAIDSDKENYSPWLNPLLNIEHIEPLSRILNLGTSPPFCLADYTGYTETDAARGQDIRDETLSVDDTMTFPPRREREYERDRIRDRRPPPFEPRRDHRRHHGDWREVPLNRDPVGPGKEAPKIEKEPKIIEDPAPKFDINEVGPHPGFIEPCRRFVFEFQIQRALNKLGTDQKDETWRMQGVTFIESIRTSLRL